MGRCSHTTTDHRAGYLSADYMRPVVKANEPALPAADSVQSFDWKKNAAEAYAPKKPAA